MAMFSPIPQPIVAYVLSHPTTYMFDASNCLLHNLNLLLLAWKFVVMLISQWHTNHPVSNFSPVIFFFLNNLIFPRVKSCLLLVVEHKWFSEMLRFFISVTLSINCPPQTANVPPLKELHYKTEVFGGHKRDQGCKRSISRYMGGGDKCMYSGIWVLLYCF